MASRSLGQIEDPSPSPAPDAISVAPEALRSERATVVVGADDDGEVVVGSPPDSAAGGVTGNVSTAVAAGTAGAPRSTAGRAAVLTAPALATTVGTCGPAAGIPAAVPPAGGVVAVAPGDVVSGVCPTVVLVTSTVTALVVGAAEVGGVVVPGAAVVGGDVAGGSVTGGSVVGGRVAGGRVVGGSVVGGRVDGGTVVDGGCPGRWCATAAGAVVTPTATDTRSTAAIRSPARRPSVRGGGACTGTGPVRAAAPPSAGSGCDRDVDAPAFTRVASPVRSVLPSLAHAREN